jgi:O-antigen/teichoic acid export membrane protein
MAAIGSVVGGAFVALTLDDLFDGDPQYVAHIVLLMVGYALLMIGKGVLAGRRRFSGVGWILIVEAAVRLLAGIIAIQVFATATSLGWAMVVGGFSVLALGWWRHDVGDPGMEPTPPRGFLGGYAGGTASSQVLLAGAPIAVAALGGSPELISIVFFTFTIYRAPLTLIFNLQGRILPYLVGLAGGTDRVRLTRIARMVLISGAGLALLGAAVGWFVGPEVMTLLLGDEFTPTRVVAMFTATGVVAAAAAQITSQVLVAEGRTTRLAMAWLGGLVSALIILLVIGGEPDTRVAVSFAAGEFVALGLMAVLSSGD